MANIKVEPSGLKDTFTCSTCRRECCSKKALSRHRRRQHRNRQAVALTTPSTQITQAARAEWALARAQALALASRIGPLGDMKHIIHNGIFYFQAKVNLDQNVADAITQADVNALNNIRESNQSNHSHHIKKETQSEDQWEPWEPTFACTLCDRTFNSPQSFDNHMAKHEAIKCPQCHKPFRSPKALDKHQILDRVLCYVDSIRKIKQEPGLLQEIKREPEEDIKQEFESPHWIKQEPQEIKQEFEPSQSIKQEFRPSQSIKQEFERPSDIKQEFEPEIKQELEQPGGPFVRTISNSPKFSTKHSNRFIMSKSATRPTTHGIPQTRSSKVPRTAKTSASSRIARPTSSCPRCLGPRHI
jgi:transcription elongation factor Elf1